MANYTFDDFQQATIANGLENQFSEADLRLARENPDAGMSLLSYKIDYGKAETDQDRARANAGAENVRSTLGGYTAGTDGAGYRVANPTPRSFSYQDFSYNPDQDPVYQSYRTKYTREGQRAMEDTMANAAAMTGGIPSSYAVSAGAIANQNYMAALGDVIPQLFQNARNNYNTDRDAAYRKFTDEIAAQTARREEERKIADRAAGYGDYSWLNREGVNTSNMPYERELALQKDQLDQQKRQTEQQNQQYLAQLAASTGDYDYIRQQTGINARPGLSEQAWLALLQYEAANGKSGLYDKYIKGHL